MFAVKSHKVFKASKDHSLPSSYDIHITGKSVFVSKSPPSGLRPPTRGLLMLPTTHATFIDVILIAVTAQVIHLK